MASTLKPSITLIGCGKMGSAMVRGWLNADIAEIIHVINPAGLPDEFKGKAVQWTNTPPPSTDVIVLAVKPQIMKDVCATLSPSPETLILSIATGQSIASFESRFGARQPIIRTMPNTPAAIGQGMTVAIANKATSAHQKALATALLSCLGQLEWIEDETWMDAITALSGSGPAYVFHLIEILANAGTDLGLPPDFSMTLARQTVIGAAALADQQSGTSASALRENVTSPNGTTAAALRILMDGSLQKIYTAALCAAAERSKELSA